MTGKTFSGADGDNLARQISNTAVSFFLRVLQLAEAITAPLHHRLPSLRIRLDGLTLSLPYSELL